MTIKDTIYIKCDNGNKTAWLPDTVVDFALYNNIVFSEIRKMLCADEGKALYDENDEYVGEAIWLNDIYSQDCLTEKEFVLEEEPIEEEFEEFEEPIEEIEEIEND